MGYQIATISASVCFVECPEDLVKAAGAKSRPTRYMYSHMLTGPACGSIFNNVVNVKILAVQQRCSTQSMIVGATPPRRLPYMSCAALKSVVVGATPPRSTDYFVVLVGRRASPLLLGAARVVSGKRAMEFITDLNY